MSTAGIVAEYNPFHNGHAYHITRTRENGASAVVCVMSSWFVQRGETALMHPNARARMALMNGADLVVSLPVPWACAAAQTFARGAVGLLDAMGCVDTLSFGSECADVTLLRAASRAVDDYTVRESLRANLLSGVSFASARQRAVEELDPRVASVLSSPNDTLAVEYIRAIDKLKSDLTPFAVKREGAGHDSGEAVNSFASASLIRTRVREGEDFDDLMPENAAEILKAEIEAGRAPADIRALEKAILASDLGINPQNDGRMIRLVFPPLTEERRKDLVKQTKKYGEEYKVAIRNVRREAIEKFKKQQKTSEITEDDYKNAEKDIQKLTDDYAKEIDKIIAAKEKELTEI